MIKSLLDNLASNLDVFLTGHKYEDVPRRKREMDLKNLFDGAVDVVFAGRFGVEYLDRECSARNGVTGRVPVKSGELYTKIRSQKR